MRRRPGLAALARRAALSAAALALLSPLSPATAQRARCGFGEGLAALRAAEAVAARPVTGLVEGRAQAEEVLASLRTAHTSLGGCGCRQAAQDAADAESIAATATAEHGAAEIAARLRRATFSMRLARERLGREGCS